MLGRVSVQLPAVWVPADTRGRLDLDGATRPSTAVEERGLLLRPFDLSARAHTLRVCVCTKQGLLRALCATRTFSGELGFSCSNIGALDLLDLTCM